jgi:hypothetical protein
MQSKYYAIIVSYMQSDYFAEGSHGIFIWFPVSWWCRIFMWVSVTWTLNYFNDCFQKQVCVHYSPIWLVFERSYRVCSSSRITRVRNAHVAVVSEKIFYNNPATKKKPLRRRSRRSQDSHDPLWSSTSCFTLASYDGIYVWRAEWFQYFTGRSSGKCVFVGCIIFECSLLRC